MNDHHDAVTIQIARRQASYILALAIMITVAVFTVGYFWGRWTAMQVMSEKVEQDSFIDQAHYALLAMYNEPATSVGSLARSTDLNGEGTVEVAAIVQDDKNTDQTKNYQGLIIGFGHYKSARDFVSKMAGRGITTLIRERASWNGTHKRVWYQVVTEPYANRAELEKLVAKISRISKVKNAKIEQCVE